MTDLVFEAAPAEETVLAELGALLPTNPFATPAFFDSQRQLGFSAWVLALRDEGKALRAGCGAFFRAGRLNRSLEVVSLPPVAADDPFWPGLRAFCRQRGVTVLQLDSFGSASAAGIPPLGARCTRRSRLEFVLDLSGEPADKLGSNHKRNLKKAEKAGLAVTRARTLEAMGVHRALMGQSMDRRRSRGEAVRAVRESQQEGALLSSGAGELFQAVRPPATVLSSVLVLHAPRGGYYYTAGTSPEGMEVGASHFLIHGIARELRAAGAQLLNLGGAEEGSSLARFKLGFGAATVQLASAGCEVGPAWRRLASGALELLRRSTGR